MVERIIQDIIRHEFTILKEEMIELMQRQKEPQRYLTRKETAVYLGLAKSTVDLWSRQGKLTKIYFGKSVRFDREEIDAILKAKSRRHV